MSNGWGNIYLDMSESKEKHIEEAMVNLIDMFVEDEYGEIEQKEYLDAIEFVNKDGNMVFEARETYDGGHNVWIEHEFLRQIRKITNDYDEVYLKKYFQKKHSILPNKILVYF